MAILFSNSKKSSSVEELTDTNRPIANAMESASKDGYGTDYSFIANDLTKIRRNLNISTGYSLSELNSNYYNKFNRFRTVFPDIELTKTFGHIFFTRPDLNLFTDEKATNLIETTVANDPLFVNLNISDKDLLKSLTTTLSQYHAFNPYLSNMALSFELKDDLLDTVDTNETFMGHKTRYGRTNIKNRTADTFSIKYREDNNYGIYKIHKAWTEYISKVYRGQFKASLENIHSRILDYACSVYYFLCGPDDETVLFWSKYTGVFPIAAPSSSSSWSSGDVGKIVDYSIDYAYSWKEDYNPLHIVEFNVQGSYGRGIVRNNYEVYHPNYIPTYESKLLTGGNTFTDYPFIQAMEDGGKLVYKLRFKKDTKNN